jgi:hypothetical protein
MKLTPGEKEVFDFLDELRDSGEKNMLDNLAHDIENEFGYIPSEARRLHRLWVTEVFNKDI